jgi:hypothetical protein
MKSESSEPSEQPGAASRRLTDPVKTSSAHHAQPTLGSNSPHPTDVPLPKKPRPPEAKPKQ